MLNEFYLAIETNLDSGLYTLYCRQCGNESTHHSLFGIVCPHCIYDVFREIKGSSQIIIFDVKEPGNNASN